MGIRQLPLVLSAAFLTALLWGCQPLTARKAAAVNDAVVAHQQEVVEALESFIDALEARDALAIGESRQALNDAATAGLKAVEGLKAPRCNTDFLSAAAGHFGFYDELARGAYADIARYLRADSITYEQFDSLQALIPDTEAARHQADAAFLKAQRDFAQGCGFKLVAHDE